MIPFWSHADRFHPQPSHRHLSQIMFHCCRPPKNPRIFQGREDFFLGDIRKPKWNCSSSKFTFPQDFLLLVIVLFSSGIRFTQHQNPLHPEFIFPGSYGDSDAFPFLGCVEDTPGGTRGVCKACKAMGASHICGIVRSLGQSLSQFCSRCFFSFQSVLQKSRATKNIFAIPEKAPTSVDIWGMLFSGLFPTKVDFATAFWQMNLMGYSCLDITHHAASTTMVIPLTGLTTWQAKLFSRNTCHQPERSSVLWFSMWLTKEIMKSGKHMGC